MWSPVSSNLAEKVYLIRKDQGNYFRLRIHFVQLEAEETRPDANKFVFYNNKTPKWSNAGNKRGERHRKLAVNKAKISEFY